MTQYTTTVDNGLDIYIRNMARRGIDPGGFRTHTLAQLAGVSRPYMSTALQQYRMTQGNGNTRYVIACEQYGPLARWRILAKPGSDPVVVQEARRQHGLWIARDAFRRYVTDRVHELQPALTNSQQDQLIDNCTILVENQFSATVTFIESVIGP